MRSHSCLPRKGEIKRVACVDSVGVRVHRVVVAVSSLPCLGSTMQSFEPNILATELPGTLSRLMHTMSQGCRD